jgi:hypothetical protein
MTTIDDRRDRLPRSLKIDADLRRKVIAQSNLVSARRTLTLAKIRCLTFDEKLRRLKKGLDEDFFDELSYAVRESERSPRQNAELASVVVRLAKKADGLPSSQRARLDRRVGRLLRALPFDLASPIVLELLSDPLKQRRELGLRRIRSEAISNHFVQFLCERFRETGDNELLKVILGKPIPLAILDPHALVKSFDDDYWRMRVIEATLKADASRGAAFASSHPLPFIWACGRLGKRSMISNIVDCLSNAPDKVPLIDITAWALGKLGAKGELARLEDLLDQMSKEFAVND